MTLEERLAMVEERIAMRPKLKCEVVGLRCELPLLDEDDFCKETAYGDGGRACLLGWSHACGRMLASVFIASRIRDALEDKVGWAIASFNDRNPPERLAEVWNDVVRSFAVKEEVQ